MDNYKIILPKSLTNRIDSVSFIISFYIINLNNCYYGYKFADRSSEL